MSSKTKIIISIILGLCFVGAFLSVGLPFYKAKAPSKTVSVVGLAEKDFVSDLIVLNFTYQTKDMDMKTAYSNLKEQTNTVKEYLKSKGITDAEITFKAISSEEDYSYQYDTQAERSFNVFTGYILRQTVRIESKEVEKIETLHKNISELLDKGININASEPDYYYTKLADLKIEMLAEATKDARARAEAIAQNAGSHLSSLKVGTMGVFQITAPNSSEDDYTWGGAFNTSSKNKRVSINMRLTYYVK
ncbi:MAG TPA: SIMPL domain-containing protein [Bacteroidales bacterium]|nr:SIMPL domain-containing protein [Bacteroidales bacterium]HPT51917.1 SIMPL domain-containing protein [Bacteroidales bacterium]